MHVPRFFKTIDKYAIAFRCIFKDYIQNQLVGRKTMIFHKKNIIGIDELNIRIPDIDIFLD